MMKASRLLVTGTVAVLLPLAAAVAQSPTPDQSAPPQQPAQSSQGGATFESLDTNADGKISKSEAAANENVSAQFTRYDKDGNGYIERSEVSSANSSPPAETPKQ
jgi:hypothetical protein